MPKKKEKKNRNGAERRSSPAVGSRMTHAEMLRNFGEIDGITLRGAAGDKVEVILEIHGRQVCVIQDFGESIDHCITRYGLAHEVCANK